MTIDLAAGLRRIKAEKQRAQLKPRPATELVSAADVVGDGRATLLLDTNVYIRSAAGALPESVEKLLDRGLLFHCAVCVAEITTGFANADPARASWKALQGPWRGRKITKAISARTV